MDFAVPADHTVKFEESEMKDKYLDLAWEWKKTVKHEDDGDTSCNWCPWYSHQRIDTRTGGLVNKKMSWNHSNYNIAKIGQNTE